MKKILIILLAIFACSIAQATIDLNTATLEELKTLPVTEQQAQDIFEYREFVSFFESIFDLRKIDSIDQETMLKIRKEVKISRYTDIDEVEKRREEIGYLLENLGNSEGSSEGMNDVWADFLMSPQNINYMLYEDLISIPNVSAVDAVAILKKRANGDKFNNIRDIRTTQGMSYYGYSNLKNYVFFDDAKAVDRVYVDYQFKMESQDFEEGSTDMFKEPQIRDTYNVDYDDLIEVSNEIRKKDNSYYGYFNLDGYQPAVSNKLRVRYGNQYKFGLMDFSDKTISPTIDKGWSDLRDDAKYYAGYEDRFNLHDNQGGAYFIKAYAGHYRATYGEGLVMENTDFYSPRKTGLGFSKRIMGITPDLSKSQSTALRGGAVEVKNDYFTSSFFYSSAKKDAIVYMEKYTDSEGKTWSVPVKDENGNYKVFSYVNSTIRFDNDDLAEAEAHFNQELGTQEVQHTGDLAGYDVDYLSLAPRTNIIDEQIIGGHVQYNPIIGTRLGFTTYTATYKNAEFIVPDGNDLMSLIIRNNNNYNKWKQPNTALSLIHI